MTQLTSLTLTGGYGGSEVQLPPEVSGPSPFRQQHARLCSQLDLRDMSTSSGLVQALAEAFSVVKNYHWAVATHKASAR